MALASLSDITLGTSQTIGRYFGIISAVPSFLLTLWIFVLFSSNAWDGKPSLYAISATFRDLSIGSTVALIASALVLALALHPIQFALVQLFEGYWGASRPARALRLRRSFVHLRRMRTAERLRADARDELSSAGLMGADFESVLTGEQLNRTPKRVRVALNAAITNEIAGTVEGQYPDLAAEIMPTRLGNTLRRWESRSGHGYDLPVLRYATELVMVANPAHVAYVNDQRSNLDLAVRMCFTSIVATSLTVLVMIPHGWYLLTALGPYTVGWLSYRGAVVVASDYGRALAALTDLNRFELYKQLHLPIPSDSVAERETNQQWVYVSAGIEGESVSYQHGASSAESGPGSTKRRKAWLRSNRSR